MLLRNLTLAAACLLVTGPGLAQETRMPTAIVDEGKLMTSTENLVCRGKVIMPRNDKKETVVFSFEKPDNYGGKGEVAIAGDKGSSFFDCRLAKMKMSVVCQTSAGPSLIPLIFQFSANLQQLTGWFGSPFDENARMEFSATCNYEE